MNRYTAAGLAADLMAGAQVAVLVGEHSGLRPAMETVLGCLPPDRVERVQRSNATTSITVSGGGGARFLPLVRGLGGWRPEPGERVLCDLYVTHHLRDDIRARMVGVPGCELIL